MKKYVIFHLFSNKAIITYIFSGTATLRESCSLSCLEFEDRCGSWWGKRTKWRRGKRRGAEHKESGSKEAALCDPHLGHKWQRQAASGILLLMDLSPSFHPARPAWQRPFCPFSYNDNILLCGTMHHRTVFGSDLHYKRSLMQQVRKGQAVLIAARTLAWFSCC